MTTPVSRVQMTSYRIVRRFYRTSTARLYKPGEIITVPDPSTPEFAAEFGGNEVPAAFVALDSGDLRMDDDQTARDEP